MTFIIGITGTIGSGKSTVCAMLKQHGIAIFDADTTAKSLLHHQAYDRVAEAFPEVLSPNGTVNRRALAEIIFHDTTKRRLLEHILHPMVRRACYEFLCLSERQNRSMVALDVPLLFETRLDQLCDQIWVTTAPELVRIPRLIRRGGQSLAVIQRIEESQLPVREKIRRADRVIFTGQNLSFVRRQVEQEIRKIPWHHCEKSRLIPKQPV